MTERQTPLTPHPPEAGRYEIRLTGHLDARWTAWFDGLTVSYESDGTTVISGPIADQAALHGLLQRVRDLGLPLVSVRQVEGDQPSLRKDFHITTSPKNTPPRWGALHPPLFTFNPRGNHPETGEPPLHNTGAQTPPRLLVGSFN